MLLLLYGVAILPTSHNC